MKKMTTYVPLPEFEVPETGVTEETLVEVQEKIADQVPERIHSVLYPGLPIGVDAPETPPWSVVKVGPSGYDTNQNPVSWMATVQFEVEEDYHRKLREKAVTDSKMAMKTGTLTG